MGKIYGENLRGKFMGKIYGENLRGKFAGKICGENLWGKFLIDKSKNRLKCGLPAFDKLQFL
jgi:hypothetical protein